MARPRQIIAPKLKPSLEESLERQLADKAKKPDPIPRKSRLPGGLAGPPAPPTIPVKPTPGWRLDQVGRRGERLRGYAGKPRPKK